MKKVLFLLMAYLPLFAWADDIAYATFENGTLTFKYGSFTPDGETSWDVSDTGTQQFYNQELSWGGQLVHVVFLEVVHSVPSFCTEVEVITQEGVDALAQLLLVCKVTIQINLSKQQC